MKKTKTFAIVSMLILLTGTEGLAQVPQATDRWEASSSRHAIEISTGYPSMHFIHRVILDLPFIISENANGIRRAGAYTTCLNLTYIYSHKEHWEFAPMVNVYLLSHDSRQYPETTDAEGNKTFDWDAEPVSRQREYEVGASLNFMARYKWLVRENWSMYSAFGIGASTLVWYPLPYLAPIGIKFGGGRVYGMVEIGVSQATVGTIGLGIRL